MNVQEVLDEVAREVTLLKKECAAAEKDAQDYKAQLLSVVYQYVPFVALRISADGSEEEDMWTGADMTRKARNDGDTFRVSLEDYQEILVQPAAAVYSVSYYCRGEYVTEEEFAANLEKWGLHLTEGWGK